MDAVVRIDLMLQGFTDSLGVSKQHLGVGLEEHWVLCPSVACPHRTLHDNHLLALPHLTQEKQTASQFCSTKVKQQVLGEGENVFKLSFLLGLEKSQERDSSKSSSFQGPCPLIPKRDPYNRVLKQGHETGP